jgi:hypothetical protein
MEQTSWEGFVEDYLCVRYPEGTPEVEAVRAFAQHVIKTCSVSPRVFDFEKADVVAAGMIDATKGDSNGPIIEKLYSLNDLPHGTVLYARRNGDAT